MGVKNMNISKLLSTILYIMLIACNASSQQTTEEKEDGFVNLFENDNLDGWEGDPAYWRIENGVVIGETSPETPPLTNNTFLIWKEGVVDDFELKTDFKITSNGNSGINYRSQELSGLPYVLSGYQADIDGGNIYTGQNYEEKGRAILAHRGEKVTTYFSENGTVKNNIWTSRRIDDELGEADSLRTIIEPQGWNEYHIIAKGNRLQHYINGVLMSDVTDEDTTQAAKKGLLGLQIHTGPAMKVEYRNLRIKTN